MKKLNINYIAGLFDGEGWIMISRSSKEVKGRKNPAYHFRIGIEITSHDILKEIVKIYSGNIYTRPQRNNRKVTYTWYLDSNNAMNFLKTIANRLFIKKRQAKIAIDYQKHVNKFTENNHRTGRKLTSKEAGYRENTVLKIRSLNSFNALRK